MFIVLVEFLYIVFGLFWREVVGDELYICNLKRSAKLGCFSDGHYLGRNISYTILSVTIKRVLGWATEFNPLEQARQRYQ